MQEYLKRLKEIYKDKDWTKVSEEIGKEIDKITEKYMFHLVHDSCEILTDHYDDFLRRKRERATWIIKEWSEGEGIMRIDHYLAKVPWDRDNPDSPIWIGHRILP